MSRRRDLWVLLPHSVRQLPADLAAILILLILTNTAVFLPGLRETPLRVGVGLVFVLFIPGYVFVAALFPEASESPVTDEAIPDESQGANGTWLGDRGIDGIERVALSFGLSIAIVPLIGLVLNFTPWGDPPRASPGERKRLHAARDCSGRPSAVGAPRGRALRRAVSIVAPGRRAELFEPDTKGDAVLNVLLALSLMLAVGSVGYAVTVPKQGESFTEFYLLTENETDTPVADNYPTEFERGESRELIVGVTNQEHERTNYTAVVELQRVVIVENEEQHTCVKQPRYAGSGRRWRITRPGSDSIRLHRR